MQVCSSAQAMRCLCGRVGEEVTISYGAFPNDVFLLFFGFVPAPNPHDAVPLFADLRDLVTAAATGKFCYTFCQISFLSRHFSCSPAAAAAQGASSNAGADTAAEHDGPLPVKSLVGSSALIGGSSSERTAVAAAAPEHARPSQLSGDASSSAEQELLRRLPPGDYCRHAIYPKGKSRDSAMRALNLEKAATQPRRKRRTADPTSGQGQVQDLAMSK